METKHIRISDYNYSLPDGRIAKFPLPRRDHSKLLLYRGGAISDDTFCRLPDYLPAGSLMVFNNTRVIQARLHFRKSSPSVGQHPRSEVSPPASPPASSPTPPPPQGALIEIFLLEPAAPADYEQMFQAKGRCSWYCLIGNLKKWKQGQLTSIQAIGRSTLTIKATRLGEHGTSHLVEFEWSLSDGQQPIGNLSFAEVIDAIGELPIPPYLNRQSEESDKTTYQTVYSKIKGSVAAPTAGLHFTPEVLSALDAKGIDREELTLHVGAGTFKPVKSEEIGGHEMHTEYFAVHRHTLEKLLQHDCCAIAVGTTSVRTLESLYYIGLHLHNGAAMTDPMHVTQWEPYATDETIPVQQTIRNIIGWLDDHQETVLHGSTQIIIVPGYEYKIVKALVTNFHQPQSTLLLLVSAFVHGNWRPIYDYALGHGFRFLSYGDSSLLIP